MSGEGPGREGINPDVTGRHMILGDEALILPAYVPPKARSLLEPHRLLLIAIFSVLIFGAIWFMRWDWLPKYGSRLAWGIWQTLILLFSTAIVGFLLAVPIGLLHDHSRHAAAFAALAALLRARLRFRAVSRNPLLLPLALSASVLALRVYGADDLVCGL
jgi:hypothetical protein